MIFNLYETIKNAVARMPLYLQIFILHLLCCDGMGCDEKRDARMKGI